MAERFISQRRVYYSPLTRGTTHSPFLFTKHDKRWRWWHLLSLLIVAIALVETILIVVGYVFIQTQPSPIRIALRQYPKINYQPLDQTTFPSAWRNSTSVYHITKEFGPATMGGMGMVLTALASEQQRTGQLEVNVVLPYYSYLKHKRKGNQFHRVADLVVYVQDKQWQQQQPDAAILDISTLPASLTPSSPSALYKSASSSSPRLLASFNKSSSIPASASSFLASNINQETKQKLSPSWVPLEFRVTKWKYVIEPPPPAVNETTWYIDDLGNNRTLPANHQRPSLKSEYLNLYLIGPGNRPPFSMAFRARQPVDIYSSPKGLPQEWKDQYFLKAAATFLSYQASAASHDQSLFAPPSDLVSPSGVDVVHIHGATNAYLAHYLQDSTLWNMALPKPSIVYTMHDYLDELQFSNTLANVYKFDPRPPAFSTNSNNNNNDNDNNNNDNINNGKSKISKKAVLYNAAESTSKAMIILPKVHGKRMFMSSLAIDLANVVTFVSQTMAAEIVEGRMDFYLKELVMENVLRKAEQGRFFGISNGVDYRHAHPFQSKRLARAKLAFPSYAWQQLTQLSHPPHRFTLSNNVSTDYVSAQKDRAKRWLIRKKFLTSEKDRHRALVLFVGRFQYNKGLASFDKAIQAFVKHNMLLVIIGQPNNYPLDQVKQWQYDYPDHVRVLTTAQEQKSWLVYVRAAADIVFVPSVTESFGLVAAEGMMFGTPVLSTGVGGLKEFLVNRPTSSIDPDWIPAQHTDKYRYNAYLYRWNQPGSNNDDRNGDGSNEDDSMEKAIEDAAKDYQYLSKQRIARELFVLNMIDSALGLGWRRKSPSFITNGRQQGQQDQLTVNKKSTLYGPVYDYLRVYNLAIQDQYNKSNIGIKSSILPNGILP